MSLTKLDKIYNSLVDWRIEEHERVDRISATAAARYLSKKAIDAKFDRISEALHS